MGRKVALLENPNGFEKRIAIFRNRAETSELDAEPIRKSLRAKEPELLASRKIEDDPRIISAYLLSKVQEIRTQAELKSYLRELNTDFDLRSKLELSSPEQKIKLHAVHLNIVLNRIKEILEIERPDHHFINEIFSDLLRALRNHGSETAWTISHTLNLLKLCSDKDLSTRIIKTLSSKLEECKDLNSQQIALCFHGLHKQDKEACAELIDRLNHKLEDCHEPFTPLQLALSFYGLYRQSNSARTIKLLNRKLNNCQENFNAIELAMCFFSLYRNPKSNKTLELLIKKLKASQEESIPQFISMCFLGLYEHNPKLINKALPTLNLRMKNCKKTFNQTNITVCLYSLQGQDTEACRETIEILMGKLKRCQYFFNAQQIGMILNGIKSHIRIIDKDFLSKWLAEQIGRLRPIDIPKPLNILLKGLCLLNHAYSQQGKSLENFAALKQSILKLYPEENILKNNTPIANEEAMRIKSIIQKLVGKGTKIQESVTHDGMPSDIYLPAYKTRVKIKSPVTAIRSSEYNFEDKYLEKTLNIRTVRIAKDSNEHEVKRAFFPGTA